MLGFLKWLFTGFGLLSAFRSRSVEFQDQEITIYCVHGEFFLWPLVLFGFIGLDSVGDWRGEGVFMGWLYIMVLAYTFVSLLFDISTPRFLLWIGIFVFIYVLALLIESRQHIHILTHVFGYLHRLQPHLDHGFAMIMSGFLLVPWIGSLFNTFTNGRLHSLRR